MADVELVVLFVVAIVAFVVLAWMSRKIEKKK